MYMLGLSVETRHKVHLFDKQRCEFISYELITFDYIPSHSRKHELKHNLNLLATNHQYAVNWV